MSDSCAALRLTHTGCISPDYTLVSAASNREMGHRALSKVTGVVPGLNEWSMLLRHRMLCSEMMHPTRRGTMATQPLPNQELVAVFDSEQESEAMVVQSLLESAGIDAIITGIDAPQDVLPGVGGVVVRVAPERANEARQVIEDYRASGAAAAEEGELSSEAPEIG
jgi:hypothetical protein